MAWDWPGYKQVPCVTAGGTQPVETEIARLRAELASANAHQHATCCMLDEAQSERDRLRAELAEAKARIAAQEILLGVRLSNVKRAEAERDAAKGAIVSLKGLRSIAEAEGDAMRSVLVEVQNYSNDPYVVKIARAAVGGMEE
jgi:hypothetical protein